MSMVINYKSSRRSRKLLVVIMLRFLTHAHGSRVAWETWEDFLWLYLTEEARAGVKLYFLTATAFFQENQQIGTQMYWKDILNLIWKRCLECLLLRGKTYEVQFHFLHLLAISIVSDDVSLLELARKKLSLFVYFEGKVKLLFCHYQAYFSRLLSLTSVSPGLLPLLIYIYIF